MRKWLIDAAQAAVMLVLIGICIGGGVALGFTAVLAIVL
nr:MAG TPA: acyl-CoA thoester hydrolase [Bacteriophage sp.]